MVNMRAQQLAAYLTGELNGYIWMAFSRIRYICLSGVLQMLFSDWLGRPYRCFADGIH